MEYLNILKTSDYFYFYDFPFQYYNAVPKENACNIEMADSNKLRKILTKRWS